MFRTILQSALLFAVAYSQILGGVSCCCFGKLKVSSSTDSQFPVKVDSPTNTRCPKCVAKGAKGKPNVAKSKVASHKSRGLKVCEDRQCHCHKIDINATEPKAPVVPMHPPVLHRSLECEETKVHNPRLWMSRFEVPIRFGGRSWQSLACIWII